MKLPAAILSAVLLSLSFTSPSFADWEKARIDDEADAGKKGVSVQYDRKARRLEFRSSNPTKILHVIFRLYDSNITGIVPGGFQTTTETSRDRFEVSIPPSGAVVFQIPDTLPTKVKITTVARKDPPPPSPFKPKNP